MSKKLTLDYIVKAFAVEGYIVLSEKYIDSSTPIKYICNKGHYYQVSWNKWKSGRRCPYCTANGRVRVVDVNYIKSEMSKEGYTLISKVYKDCATKLECLCPKDHLVYISWDAWKSKSTRCPECSGNKKLNFEYVKSQFELEDYKLLSDCYINARSKLRYKCPKGHKHSITWDSWNVGARCPLCSGKAKLTIELVKRSFESEGYNLLTKVYTNRCQKLDYICPNGHKHNVAWGNWNYGQRCPYCSNCGVSIGEKALVDSLKSLGIFVIENDRKLIAPYELDIVIPSKNIAIEYCGLYWHSELNGKDKMYHKNKLDMCEAKGIRLITVFEDEWELNKDIVISRLKTILGISKNTVYARKCIIKEITGKEAKDFCNEHHLQGYGFGSSIKLGAFNAGDLVSVMTFSKLIVGKGSASIDSAWELYRFCSKKDYSVVGVASKLLKYFERSYKISEVVAYADRRWSNGDIYNKLGFSFSHITKPNYWYFKGTKKRIHRFSKRKIQYEPTHISEWRLRQDESWNRVWDCGNLKFIKKLEIS